MIRSKFLPVLLTAIVCVGLLASPVKAATIDANPASVSAGATVTVTWNGISSPTATDWIGLYAQGAPNTSFLDWNYVSCTRTAGSPQPSGSCPFPTASSLPAGNYQLRLLANNGYVSLATVNLTVTGPILTASPSGVAPGGTETASWSGITAPTSRDWIGLYAAGASDTSYLDWFYVSCTKTAGSAAGSGACPFTAPGSLGTYELRLFANNVFTRLSTSNQFTVSLLPVVSIGATDATATEGTADTGTFTVSRTGSLASDLTVNYTVGGTATNGPGAGADYQTLTGSVTILATQQTATITVTTINDGLAEGDETVIVTLSTNANYTVGSPASATVTIIDDEPPLPIVTLTVTDNTAAEATPVVDTGVFTVSRTGNLASDLTVNYTVGGTATNGPGAGADYQTLTGSVVILATQQTATITVTPIDDGATEPNETVIVTLSPNPGVYSVGSPASGTVTIIDNDGPSLTVSPTVIAPGGTVTATWNGIGSSATSRDWIGLYAPGAANTSYLDWVYVSCTRTAGSPLASGSCAFPPTNSLAPGNYELRFLSNNAYVSLATSNQFTVSGPLPVVTIVATDNTATEAGLTTGFFTVSRTGNTALALTVNYTISGTATNGPGTGADYQTLSGSVVITATQPSATITVTPINDTLSEGNETVILTLSPNAAYQLGSPASATVTIVDDEPPPVTVSTSVLPTGVVSTPYNPSLTQTFTASGGTAPYHWSLAPGSVLLPQGLSLSTGGVISGTPVSTGSSFITVQAVDSGAPALTGTRSLMLTIVHSDVKPLVGYWSFDDGTATDNSGSITTTSLVGNPEVKPGKFGNALLFNGTSQYVTDSVDDLDAGTGDLSIFAWVKTTQTGTKKMIVSKRNSTDVSSGGYQLFQNGNALSYIIGNDSGTVLTHDYSGPKTGPFIPINDGGWHFVGVVFNRNNGINGSGTGVLYVDGIPEISPGNISSLFGNNIATTNQFAPLRFGAETQTNPIYLWDGYIDEVRVYTRRTFSDSEVLDMFNRTLAIVSDTLPAGAVSASYNQTLAGSGGTLPYTWSLLGAPSWLSISPSGTISGTPTTTAGSPFTFTVQLDDADPLIAPVQKVFSLTINANPATLFFSDNFTGANNWLILDDIPPGCATNVCEGPSNWVISNGEIVQRSNIYDGNLSSTALEKRGTFAYMNTVFTDYDFSLRVMSEDNDTFGVMFRIQNSTNYYRFSMDSERHYRRLVKMINGVPTSLAEDTGRYELGQSYNLRVSVKGNTIKVYLNLRKIIDVVDTSLPTLPEGLIALYTWGDEYVHFADVSVTSN